MKYLFCVYDDGSQAKRPSIGEREDFREKFRENLRAFLTRLAWLTRQRFERAAT